MNFGYPSVGGVAVEVLASAGCKPMLLEVGVAYGDRHATRRYARVERGHDERGPQHVGMHQTVRLASVTPRCSDRSLLS